MRCSLRLKSCKTVISAFGFIAKKKSSHEFKKIISNISWLFGDLVIRMLLSLFVGVLVARYLGPQQYGQLSFVLAITTIFAGIVPLGLQNVVIREVNRNADKVAVLLGTSFSLSIIMGIVTYLLLLQTVAYARPNDSLINIMVAISGFGLFFKSFDVIKYWFEAHVMSKYVVLVQNASLVFSAMLKITLIWLALDIIYFVWVTVVEIFITSLLLAYIYLKKSEKVGKWRFSLHESMKLIKESWHLLLSSLAIILNLNLDKILIGQLSGDLQLGFYSVASNLSQVWYTIPVIIGASLAPSLTKLYDENRALYEYRVGRVFQGLFWIAVLLSIIISVFGEAIISVVFGEGYKESADILIIQIYITIFLFHISFRKRLLIIEGKSVFIFYLSISMLLTSIFLNLYLIPIYGAKGAAYSSLISWTVNALFFPIFFKATRQHPVVFFTTIFLRK